jgi:hypothetical protein
MDVAKRFKVLACMTVKSLKGAFGSIEIQK